MNKLAAIVALASSLCLAAECTPSPAPPRPDPADVGPPPHDTGPDWVDGPAGCSSCTGTCNCACCVMAWHNVDETVRCPEALPTAKGEACEQVCREAQSFGSGALALPTLCIIKATTLEQLRACGVCRP